MEEWITALLAGKGMKKETAQDLSKLTLLLHKAIQFVQYEQKDWKYHHHTKKEMRSFYLYKSNCIYYSKSFTI